MGVPFQTVTLQDVEPGNYEFGRSEKLWLTTMDSFKLAFYP